MHLDQDGKYLFTDLLKNIWKKKMLTPFTNKSDPLKWNLIPQLQQSKFKN